MMASSSVLYIILQITWLSVIRSSWHRFPIVGIVRDWGMLKLIPYCNCLSRIPASMRAALENGGVLISPCSHTMSLSSTFIEDSVCHIRHIRNDPEKAREVKGFPLAGIAGGAGKSKAFFVLKSWRHSGAGRNPYAFDFIVRQLPGYRPAPAWRTLWWFFFLCASARDSVLICVL